MTALTRVVGEPGAVLDLVAGIGTFLVVICFAGIATRFLFNSKDQP